MQIFNIGHVARATCAVNVAASFAFNCPLCVTELLPAAAAVSPCSSCAGIVVVAITAM